MTVLQFEQLKAIQPRVRYAKAKVAGTHSASITKLKTVSQLRLLRQMKANMETVTQC